MTLIRLTLSLLAAIPIAFLSAFFIGESLLIRDEPTKADICHVLAGPDYRAHYAFDLYRQGLCGSLLFIGGQERNSMSFAELRKRLAVAEGVPPEAVEIDETDVFSSFAEVERLKIHIERTGSSEKPSVMMISDAFHMRRLDMIYGWIVGDEPEVLLAPVPFEQTPFPRAWWTSKIATWFVGKEIVKILFYQLRYRLPSVTAKTWLAYFDKIND